MLNTIECNSIKGGKVKVLKDRLVFRPAAYAIIIHQGKILMNNTRSNGKPYFPGGGINLGEKVEDTLKREVKEETGIEIEIEKFLTYHEGFFYYDPTEEAFHSLSFYYICKAKTFELLNKNEVVDDEAGEPYWIEIDKIKSQKDNLESVREILKLL